MHDYGPLDRHVRVFLSHVEVVVLFVELEHLHLYPRSCRKSRLIWILLKCTLCVEFARDLVLVAFDDFIDHHHDHVELFASIAGHWFTQIRELLFRLSKFSPDFINNFRQTVFDVSKQYP